MATRSFTNEYRFSRKDADNLIHALNNDQKPKLAKLPAINKVEDTTIIKQMFKKREQNNEPQDY